MTPQPQNAAAESASCLTSAMLRVARLALSTSASQLSQACHTNHHTPTRGMSYVWHAFLRMALLPSGWLCACHSAGFLGEKQLSNNFTTCFSDLKGPCLASQQPVGKTFSRALPPRSCYVQALLESLAETQRPCYKASLNTTQAN